jgi:hypothetical protein
MRAKVYIDNIMLGRDFGIYVSSIEGMWDNYKPKDFKPREVVSIIRSLENKETKPCIVNVNCFASGMEVKDSINFLIDYLNGSKTIKFSDFFYCPVYFVAEPIDLKVNAMVTRGNMEHIYFTIVLRNTVGKNYLTKIRTNGQLLY